MSQLYVVGVGPGDPLQLTDVYKRQSLYRSGYAFF